MHQRLGKIHWNAPFKLKHLGHVKKTLMHGLNKGDNSKQCVDGNIHICEIYLMACMIRFLCSSLSIKHQKQLPIVLNALVVKT